MARSTTEGEIYKTEKEREFPGGPLVRTHALTANDSGLIPGLGTKILQTAWCCQKKKVIRLRRRAKERKRCQEGQVFQYIWLREELFFLFATEPIYLSVDLCILSCCLVTKSCLTLCNPMDCSLPGSSVLGISKARTLLEWVAIFFRKPREKTQFTPC